jgi:hypothetical protein
MIDEKPDAMQRHDLHRAKEIGMQGKTHSLTHKTDQQSVFYPAI